MGVILNFSQHDQRNQVAPLLPVKLAFYLSPNKDKNFFLACQVFFCFFLRQVPEFSVRLSRRAALPGVGVSL